MPGDFALHGVVHLVRTTGFAARDLDELRTALAEVEGSSLFYHAHHPQLRHPGAGLRPSDDVSAWVDAVLQDHETAERLSFATQDGGRSADTLRAAWLRALDATPAGARRTRRAPEASPLILLAMESIAVDTGVVVHDGDALVQVLTQGDPRIAFYHLLEQPWLAPREPSLIAWVESRGEAKLAAWLGDYGHDGRPLDEARRRIAQRWQRSHLASRLAEAAGTPPRERAQEAREVLRGLVRRMTDADDAG